MQKLRGTGYTFSTSGKDWRPFRFNPRIASQKARLHRIKNNGLALPPDKAAMRQVADIAAATHPITKV